MLLSGLHSFSLPHLLERKTILRHGGCHLNGALALLGTSSGMRRRFEPLLYVAVEQSIRLLHLTERDIPERVEGIFKSHASWVTSLNLQGLPLVFERSAPNCCGRFFYWLCCSKPQPYDILTCVKMSQTFHNLEQLNLSGTIMENLISSPSGAFRYVTSMSQPVPTSQREGLRYWRGIFHFSSI